MKLSRIIGAADLLNITASARSPTYPSGNEAAFPPRFSLAMSMAERVSLPLSGSPKRPRVSAPRIADEETVVATMLSGERTILRAYPPNPSLIAPVG